MQTSETKRRVQSPMMATNCELGGSNSSFLFQKRHCYHEFCLYAGWPYNLTSFFTAVS